MTPARAHIILALIVVAWGGAFAAIKHLLGAGMTGPEVALARYLVAAPGFAIALWATGGLPGIGRRGLLRIAVCGLLVVTTYHVALNEGERFTTSGTGAVIIGTAPGMTLGLSLALGLERFSPARLAGLAVAFAGVLVVVLLGSGEQLSPSGAKGPLLVLIAPLAFALYNVIAKPLLERHDPIAVSAAASLIGTVGLLPLLSAHPVATARGLGAEEWVLILYLGLACTLAAYIGWTLALRQLDPSRAVAYLYCVPVLGVVTGAVALDEPVTGWLVLGAGLVVAGVAVAQFGSLRRTRPEPVDTLSHHGQGVRRGAGGRGGRGRA